MRRQARESHARTCPVQQYPTKNSLGSPRRATVLRLLGRTIGVGLLLKIIKKKFDATSLKEYLTTARVTKLSANESLLSLASCNPRQRKLTSNLTCNDGR
jgi:hypothetical protein